MATISGSCGCGQVQYLVNVPKSPWTYACHCGQCQSYSGSAFALYTPAYLAQLTIYAGSSAKDWKVRSDGTKSTVTFCPLCGSKLVSVNSYRPDLVFLRSGTLDCVPELSPAAHMWTVRKASCASRRVPCLD